MSLAVNSYHDEGDEPELCRVCGCELDWVDCWECGGEGQHDLHDEDPINFAPDEEYERCQLCGGHCGWLECPNVASHAKAVAGQAETKPEKAGE